MHHMKVRKMLKQEARAKINGYHKNPPWTQEDQERITAHLNKLLSERKNVQLQLI